MVLNDESRPSVEPDALSLVFRTILRVLGSYGLSVVLIVLMLVLTYLGTLEQVNSGLYQVQKKYFESVFLVHYAYGFPIPLPGAYLLMTLLFVNLILGGLVRVRWSLPRTGLLIAHFGILFLLFGSFVSYRAAVHGNLTLYEGEAASEFTSYYDWEIAVLPAPDVVQVATGAAKPTETEYIIPESDFVHLGSDEFRTFRGEGIPFQLTLRRVMANSWPVADRPGTTPTNPVIAGIFLEEREKDPTEERNLLGAYVDIRVGGEVESKPDMLWGGAEVPLFVDAGGQRWAVELRKRRFALPFKIRLDKFTHEFHPGTRMPKVFMSDVTKIEGGVERQIKIEMNQPLRHKGYTLFQSNWGPQDARPGTPLFSGFSVVKNPADQWPLWACIVISVGLLIHFTRLLVRYLRAEAGGRS